MTNRERRVIHMYIGIGGLIVVIIVLIILF
jgi:hypothetical protein